jgi:hypothetical protein
MQSVRKPQRFTNLPISLKLSSTKRVWLNVVGAIKTAGVRILRIFVRILQTKFSPRDTVPALAFIACIPMKSLVDREGGILRSYAGHSIVHHEIADALLPQPDPVFDDAPALDATVDMLDP